MMRSRSFLLVCALLTTTTRAQPPTPPATLLLPGQTWVIRGTLPDQSEDGFTITLGAKPSHEHKGIVVYQDTIGKRLDEFGRVVWARLWHDPQDADPEYLHATWLVPLGIGKKLERHCFLWHPSDQTSTTQFSGVYAATTRDLEAYVLKGETRNLGECTLTLQPATH